MNLFRHPIQAIETIVEARIAAIISEVQNKLTAIIPGPGLATAITAIEETLHLHLGEAVNEVHNHVKANPTPAAAAAAPSTPAGTATSTAPAAKPAVTATPTQAASPTTSTPTLSAPSTETAKKS